MLIGKLNCGVDTFTQRANGRQKVLTRIFVRMGQQVIADRVIPGKWTEVQALKEFRRFPERFTPRPSYDAALLKAVAA